MTSCFNYNLPYFQNLSSVYGDMSMKEILSKFSTDSFRTWYGNENEFPIVNNHIVTNNKGETRDVRDLIFYTKQYYDDYVNREQVTQKNSLDSIFEKRKQQRLVVSNKSLSLLGQEKINNIIKESIDDIKLKTVKTYDEEQLLNGKVSIENYFGLNKNYQYLPSNKYDTQDNLFEVYHKLKLYADKKYLPLLDFLIKNSNNVDIKFEKVNSEKRNNKLMRITDSKFSALYKPIIDTNSSIIFINEYQLKKDNFIKGPLTYDNVVSKLIIHELLHDYTNYRFYIDDDFKKKFDNILLHIRKNLSNEELLEMNHILSDSRELITYLFSDDVFKSKLSSIPSNNSDAYHQYIDIIKKAIGIKDKSIIDDILSGGLKTIQIKSEYNMDYENIQRLKDTVKVMYAHIDERTLLPILTSIEKDWLISKLNNLNFTTFKQELLNRIKDCL